MSVFMLRARMSCQQFTELVTAYLDDALPRRISRAITDHIAACPECTEYLAQVRRTIAVTGQLPDEPVPDEIVDALTAAFRALHGRAPDANP